MVTNDRGLCHQPTMKVLSQDQVERIHLATLAVLERTGIRITHLKALELLGGAGASVNGDRVRIPAQMVEDALHTSPSRFALGQRNGEPAIILEDNKSWHGAGLDGADYLNPVTDERRRFTSEDCRVTASISNALPNYSWSMTLDLIDRVGPGGHYLEEEHTMQHFRDVWYPELFDRTNYDEWLQRGSTHFAERLREKTRSLMDFNSEPLPTELVKELDRMAKG